LDHHPNYWGFNKTHIPNHQSLKDIGKPYLVGGFNHLEKYESQWEG